MDAGPRVSWSSCVSLLKRGGCFIAVALVSVLAVVSAAPAAGAGFDPAAVFNLQCAGCHSVGQGRWWGRTSRG